MIPTHHKKEYFVDQVEFFLAFECNSKFVLQCIAVAI